MRLKIKAKKDKTILPTISTKNASLILIFISSLFFCIFGSISKTVALLSPITETDLKYDKLIQPTNTTSSGSGSSGGGDGDNENVNCTIEIPSPVATVAYAVSVTSCPPRMAGKMYNLGVVLKKSIELNSYPVNSNSRYASKVYVFVTPEVEGTGCIKYLQAAGFTPRYVDFPVKAKDIQVVEGLLNLRKEISKDGCCGEKELVKLHVYSMTDHPVAIHLDLDTLLVQPLDPIIDAMVYDPCHPIGEEARKRLFAPSTQDTSHDRLASPTYRPKVPLTELHVDAYFTKDYNMFPRIRKKVGMQGGMLIVKPNNGTRDKLINYVLSGRYYNGRGVRSGWFQSGYGRHIWGSLTIQGLLAYYYNEVANSTSIELHRCRFNQIADNPRRSSFDRSGKYPRGTYWNDSKSLPKDMDCRDGRKNCDDVQCQTWPIEKSYLLHYTYCKSPMNCVDGSYNETKHDHQCHLMHKEWFSTLESLMQEANYTPMPSGQYFPELYKGFCKAKGAYTGIPLPYGA